MFGLRPLAFQSVLLGCGLSFFIGGGWTVHSCGCFGFGFGHSGAVHSCGCIRFGFRHSGTVHSCDYIRFGFGHSGTVHFAVTLGLAISFAGLLLP